MKLLHLPPSLLLCLAAVTLPACDEESSEPRAPGLEDDGEYSDEDEEDSSSGDIEFAGGVWDESTYLTFPDEYGNPHGCGVNFHTGTINHDYWDNGFWIRAGTQRTVANFAVTCMQPRVIMGYTNRHGSERSRAFWTAKYTDWNLPEITADIDPEDTAHTATFCVATPSSGTRCASLFR